ncbi:MAG: hypothetical protein EBT20_04735 [Alphaproteobacteria bacterium]|nr:hypothetical protein [Alphaproteobacteria bacterium]
MFHVKTLHTSTKGGYEMKIQMNIECTPQEARAALGLPDLEPLHAIFIDQMTEQLKQTADQLDPNEFVKTWAPLGAQSLDAFNKMFTTMATGMNNTSTSKREE